MGSLGLKETGYRSALSLKGWRRPDASKEEPRHGGVRGFLGSMMGEPLGGNEGGPPSADHSPNTRKLIKPDSGSPAMPGGGMGGMGGMDY